MAQKADIRLKNVKVLIPQGKTLFTVADLEIPYGTHLLLQGKSGEGKTTFLHLLAGLLQSDEGEVWIGESNLNTLSDSERCNLRRSGIGVVFQRFNLIDHLTVKENIELSSKNQDDAVLRKVDLVAKADTLVSALSQGEQQRVAVARILAQNVDIILADEPTSSLDKENMKFVMQALKEKAQGKTLIVVSHDDRISSYFDKTLQFTEIQK